MSMSMKVSPHERGCERERARERDCERERDAQRQTNCIVWLCESHDLEKGEALSKCYT